MLPIGGDGVGHNPSQHINISLSNEPVRKRNDRCSFERDMLIWKEGLWRGLRRSTGPWRSLKTNTKSAERKRPGMIDRRPHMGYKKIKSGGHKGSRERSKGSALPSHFSCQLIGGCIPSFPFRATDHWHVEWDRKARLPLPFFLSAATVKTKKNMGRTTIPLCYRPLPLWPHN